MPAAARPISDARFHSTVHVTAAELPIQYYYSQGTRRASMLLQCVHVSAHAPLRSDSLITAQLKPHTPHHPGITNFLHISASFRNVLLRIHPRSTSPPSADPLVKTARTAHPTQQPQTNSVGMGLVDPNRRSIDAMCLRRRFDTLAAPRSSCSLAAWCARCAVEARRENLDLNPDGPQSGCVVASLLSRGKVTHGGFSPA